MSKRGRPKKKSIEEETTESLKDKVDNSVDRDETIEKLTKQIIKKTEVRMMGSLTTAKEKRMIKAIVEVMVDLVS